MKQILFITGTDTGVGKTVLTALLVRFLREGGVKAVALKPVCSGGRDDARELFAVMDGLLTLDEINPWHFRTPLSPLLAARGENKCVKLTQVLAHIRKIEKCFDMVLVEGAGGLLSPLGEHFNSRDLIVSLGATPIIVAQNRLGAINHVLLALAALPKNLRLKTRVLLFSPPKPDASTKTNAGLLAEFFDVKKIFLLPWFGSRFSMMQVLKTAAFRQTLKKLAH